MDPAGSTTAELQNCRWYFVSHQFGIVIDVVTSCIAMVFVAQGELQMTRSQGRIKRLFESSVQFGNAIVSVQLISASCQTTNPSICSIWPASLVFEAAVKSAPS